MKVSEYKSYDELPLFLNAATVAKALGVSSSSGYELMHEPDFPVLKVHNPSDTGSGRAVLSAAAPPAGVGS